MQKRRELVARSGLHKVSAEIAFGFLAYNLCRAINLLGVGVLAAYFNEKNA